MQSFWKRHMTQRRRQADGTWVTDCACGWVSGPAPHRDALGWVCPRETAEVALMAVVRDLADIYTLDTDQAAVIRLVHRAKTALATIEGRAS